MEYNEFLDRFGSLAAELEEYWDGEESTGKEEDDPRLAQRWLVEHYGNPLSINIETLKGILSEARDVLAHFDECAPFVIKELNLGRTNTPAKARAWLEKMIPIWEEVLGKVEEKWRTQGGGDSARGCRP